ncbi:MAG TPA: hypothetical protein VFM18_22325 [Methanosarcina sp.]|nr:hypothetical protein [Methanosarcina sp.]
MIEFLVYFYFVGMGWVIGYSYANNAEVRFTFFEIIVASIFSWVSISLMFLGFYLVDQSLKDRKDV